MKILKRILGLALAAAMIACAVLVLASCSEQERLEKESREYLKEKYGKTDFELVSYTQNKTTRTGPAMIATVIRVTIVA